MINNFVLIKTLHGKFLNVYKNNEFIDQLHYDSLDDLFDLLKSYYSDELLGEGVNF